MQILNPEEELIVAPRSTCTKDEAVARLLGWMKGPQFSKNIPFGQFGVPTNQYVNLQFLEGSIQNQLTLYRETARQEWMSANASGKDDSGQSAKLLLDCYDLAAKAEKYLMEIGDEIAKEGSSALRIDRAATVEEQETHYTLKSVDEWAKRTLGLSVIQTEFHEHSPSSVVRLPDISPVAADKNGAPSNVSAPNSLDAGKESGTHENVDLQVGSSVSPGITDKSSPGCKYECDQESDPKMVGKGLGQVKANNLYIAFALLVEAFASSNSGYATSAGDSIEDAIAKHIATIGKKSNKDQFIPGVCSGAIRKNIAEAMKRKAKKLNWG